MGVVTEKPTSIEFMWKSFLAGGIAGMCSKTAVAPLDRIKILLQAHSKHYKNYGVFSGLREIVAHENFLALYKGNGAQMVRIFPYAAVQFTAYEMYKKYLTLCFGKQSHIAKFLSGSSAGVTAVCLTYPLDTIRARLAFQVTGEHVYKGIIHAAVSISKNEGGLRALYRGFLPTVCGMIPYAGSSFYCFEMFKYCCMKYLPNLTCTQHSRNTGGLALNVFGKLACGGLAGAVAQSLSYPLDVTRRRMQLAMMNPETQKFAVGMFRTLWLIYKENGIVAGLYRGGCFRLTFSCGYFPVVADESAMLDEFLNGPPNFKYSFEREEINGFFAPVKYHPTVFLQKYTVLESPLNSACMKCGICLAVSEKLEQILQFALKSSISLDEFNDYLSAQLLRPICDYAFKSYGLKEWNGLRFISQYSFLETVPNSFEGRWWEILKDSCHFYLTHFGDKNFVKAWLSDSQNATSLLCRNDGLFRDCLNIDQGILTIQLPQKFLIPGNHAEITYPCA